MTLLVSEHVWSVYQAAISRSKWRRSAFLDRACAGEPRLREEVELLLILYSQDSLSEFVRQSIDEAVATPLPKRDGRNGRKPTRIGDEVCRWSYFEDKQQHRYRWVVEQGDSRWANPYYEGTCSCEMGSIFVSHGNRRCGMFGYWWHMREMTAIEFEAIRFERGETKPKDFLAFLLRDILLRETPNNDWPT